jgi:uncharacterized membrane protein YobD (UPF0266 family)
MIYSSNVSIKFFTFLQKKIFLKYVYFVENFNISENNIISVELAQVACMVTHRSVGYGTQHPLVHHPLNK